MNKEIELLNNKLDAQDKIINEQVLEIARLKSKCEILEENNKLLIQQKQQMYEDLDIAYRRIDKAKEYTKSHTDKLKTTRVPKIDFNYNELLDILEAKDE